MNRLSVIGAGNLGCALIQSLKERGWELKFILKKSKDPRFSRYITNDLEQLIESSDLILLAVQESKIAAMATEIAEYPAIRGKTVLHTSNSLSSLELEPIRRKGGYTASFSPLQTFPACDLSSDIFKGIPFLIEGDTEAVHIAEKTARDLEAEAIQITQENKIPIHIAAVAVSNFLVALFTFAERRMTHAGIPEKISILYPLFRQTWENIFKSGSRASLSGPLVRGEEELIESHLDSLQGIEKNFYRLMTDYLRTIRVESKRNP